MKNEDTKQIARRTFLEIAGIDVELQIFGVYYLYLRAVISEKVTKT